MFASYCKITVNNWPIWVVICIAALCHLVVVETLDGMCGCVSIFKPVEAALFSFFVSLAF